MQELIKALIKAQSSFEPIRKDRVNPHYKSKYATLDSVLSAVNPALAQNGLVLSQMTKYEEDRFLLVTRLYHESGEYIESIYLLPDISDAQKLGSALTYARRYSVCALLNVTADEDDDGNTAVSSSKKQKEVDERPQRLAQTKALYERLKKTTSYDEPFSLTEASTMDEIKSTYVTYKELLAAPITEIIEEKLPKSKSKKTAPVEIEEEIVIGM